MSDSHDLYDAERVTVGTIGPTGQRVFLLQGRQGSLTVTVKLEKQQVAALSQYLAKVLEELPDPGILPEDLELEEPLDAAWVVGTLGLSYDSTADRLYVVSSQFDYTTEPTRLAVSEMDLSSRRHWNSVQTTGDDPVPNW